MKKQKHEIHGAVTRRQLLGQGIIGASAYIAMPSLLSMLSSGRAFGAPMCGGAAGTTSLTPFLCYDLAGGCSIAGSNVIVGKKGGQSDFLGASSYRTIGLPDDMHPSVSGMTNNEFGLLFHSDSGFLRGMLATTSVTTRAKVDGVVFCTVSADDTGNNPLNPTYFINKAGATGQLAKIVGTNNSESGGNSIPATGSIDPSARPVLVQKPADCVSLVTPSKLASLLSPTDAERILNATKTMSASQLAKFSGKPISQQLQDLVDCGYIQSVELQTKFDANKVDPRKDAIVTALYPELATNGFQQRSASITKLLLDGSAGAGTIENGGYDYHTGERAVGEAKDFEAGQMIGRALEFAALKNQDLCIYIFTDGGLSSNGELDTTVGGRGKGNWQGDSSSRAAAFMLVYKKDGRPTIRNNMRQIGAYQDNGSVDIQASKISTSVDNLSKVVVANYMALHGTESKLKDVVGDHPFEADLDQYLAFAKLR